MTELFLAVNNNDIDKVKELLDEGYDPSLNDNDASVLASFKGYLDILKLLVRDRRVNLRNTDAIHLAAKNGHLDVVKFLLNKRAFHKENLYYIAEDALENSHIEVVKTLAQHNRFILSAHRNSFIRIAAEKGDVNMVEYLLSQNIVDAGDKRNEAIINAAENGHLKTVKLLLANPKVNASARESSALLMAAKNGHLEIVKLLLKVPNINPGAADNFAIFWSAENCHVEIFKLLINDPRVNPNARNGDLIMVAARDDCIEIVKIILFSDRFINKSKLQNAFNKAVTEGFTEEVELFLDFGVDPSLNDNYAIKLASEGEYIDIVKLLLKDPRVYAREKGKGYHFQNYHNSEIAEILSIDNEKYPNPTIRKHNRLIENNINKLKNKISHLRKEENFYLEHLRENEEMQKSGMPTNIDLEISFHSQIQSLRSQIIKIKQEIKSLKYQQETFYEENF